jgi:hypothetical protein
MRSEISDVKSAWIIAGQDGPSIVFRDAQYNEVQVFLTERVWARLCEICREADVADLVDNWHAMGTPSNV